MAGSLFEDSEDYFMRLSSRNIVRAAGLLSVTSVHIITRVNGRKIQTNILLTTDNYTAAAAQTHHGRPASFTQLRLLGSRGQYLSLVDHLTL